MDITLFNSSGTRAPGSGHIPTDTDDDDVDDVDADDDNDDVDADDDNDDDKGGMSGGAINGIVLV